MQLSISWLMPRSLRMLLSAHLLVLSLMVNPIMRAQGGDSIYPFKIYEHSLDNGLKLIVVPTDYPDLVSLQIAVSVGSRNEVEDGRSGFAHFFEHMMFRGTKSVSSTEYNESLKNAGADSNAYTTNDYTNYHTTFSRDDLELVLRLEADRFQSLDYSEGDFRTEAKAVLGEYNKNYANPLTKLLEIQRDLAFDRHTYKHTTMGFLRDIKPMPEMFDYSRQFFRRFYRPERTTIIVTGDVQEDEVVDLVKQEFGLWARGSVQEQIPEEPAPKGPRYSHVPWETPTPAWVTIAFRGPEGSSADMSALELLAEYAFSPSSKLYQQLVISEQRADRLFAYFPRQIDPFLLTVAARVKDPKNLWRVRDAIQAELSALKTSLPEEGRFEAIKTRMRYAFASTLDNSEAIADALVPSVGRYRDPSALMRRFSEYADLSAEAIQTVAQRYFQDRGMVVVTLAHGEIPESGTPVGSVSGVTALKGLTGTKPVDHLLMPSASPLVDFRFVIRSGARQDPPGKSGLAALTAAMLTQSGTTDATYEEIQRQLFPLAASFSHQVDQEMTTFSGRCHREVLNQYLPQILPQLLRPGWRAKDFERVKANQIAAIRADLRGNNDEELGKEVLYERIFEGHPYGHLPLGHAADVEKLTIADLKSFYAKHYLRNNLVLGMAGGFEKDVPDVVMQWLAVFNAGKVEVKPLPKPKPVDGLQVTIVEKDVRATALSFGFPIQVTRSHKDFAALWLVRSWLGEHRSSNSHLFQRMREVRGMNYGDYAYIEYFPRGMFQFHPDAGLGRRQQIFQTWIRPVAPQQAVFALRLARHEIDKLIANGLTAEQFESTRNYLIKFLAVLVKSQDRRLGYAMDSVWYGMGDYVSTMRSRLRELTLSEVNQVIKRHLQTKDIQVVFVAKDAKQLKDKLVSGAASPISYESEKPRSLLKEDQAIMNLPLDIKQEAVRIVPVGRVFED